MKRKLINLVLSIIGTVLEFWGWCYLGYVLETSNNWYEFPFIITAVITMAASIIFIMCMAIVLEED